MPEQPITDSDLAEFETWAEWLGRPGRINVSGTPPKVGGLIRLIEERAIHRLIAEVKAYRQIEEPQAERADA